MNGGLSGITSLSGSRGWKWKNRIKQISKCGFLKVNVTAGELKIS